MKNLKLARAAIENRDFVKAKTYYEEILKESPENLEAEWFYHFGSILEEINEETANHYTYLADNFYPTLKYIAPLDESEEKQIIAASVIKDFLPLGDVLHDTLIKAKAGGYLNISVEEISKINLAILNPKKIDKKQLANDIISIFGEKKPYCLWSADIWKELIAERFKWSEYRNFQDRGKELWFDELGKKIKKYDPSYVMPQFKQAGCVSTGDAAKVTPGD